MKQVLVVDDSPTVRKLVKRMLESMNFRVAEAEDGRKALHCCRAMMPDAILLDWNMPAMDGLEFLINLRKLPGGAGPKVVFCTTENQRPKIQLAMNAGADEYIMKPFDEQIIREKLEQIGLV